EAENLLCRFVFFCRQITTTFLDSKLYLKLSRFIEVADNVFRVQDFKRRSKLRDIASLELFLLFDVYDNLVIEGISHLLEASHLEVQDDFRHVFYNTFDSRELMEYARDLDSRHRISL